jgi:streptogramin lyase
MGNTTVKLPRIFLSLPISISISASLAAFCLAAIFSTVFFLSGCGGSVSTGGGGGGGGGGSCTPSVSSSTPASCPSRTPVAGVSFTGKVLASAEPVSGASVQLYAAGNTGNGSAPTALLTSAVATASDGSFTISSGYLCPSAQTPVYLVSKGGQPASASAPSSALWLMSALRPCGSLNSGEAFVVNEVTTAASVWALASFMSGGGNVGASCTNTIGLDNAFFTASRLANFSTGASPGAGLPSTLAVPTAKLNSLANALASCTGGSGSCAALFSAATFGSAVPTNTLDATLNIARAPGNNVAAIYALAGANSVFSPALTAAPPDWMLHNTVSGGGMNLPASLGVDASGNVWASNYFNTVSEFSPAGNAVYPAGISGSGINESYGMALDVQGNVWIANEQTTAQSGTGDVTELNSSGQPIATGITSGGIYFPLAVAADTNGDMWIADYGDSKVSLLSSSGSAISSSTGWGGTSLAFPVAIAVDADHNAWVANQGGLLPVTKISADGTEVTNYDCDCDGASGVATDQSGNVWIANYYGNSISEVNTCGKLEVDAAMGGGLVRPQGIAVDGAGTVWVANYQGNSLSELGSSSSATAGMLLSPSTGFGADSSLVAPYALAIDASGNLWVTNSGKNTLTQFIGVATPVKTPLAGPPQAP